MIRFFAIDATPFGSGRLKKCTFCGSCERRGVAAGRCNVCPALSAAGVGHVARSDSEPQVTLPNGHLRRPGRAKPVTHPQYSPLGDGGKCLRTHGTVTLGDASWPRRGDCPGRAGHQCHVGCPPNTALSHVSAAYSSHPGCCGPPSSATTAGGELHSPPRAEAGISLNITFKVRTVR